MLQTTQGIDALIRDIKTRFPDITPSQVISLINAGVNLNNLVGNGGNVGRRSSGDRTILSSSGINTSSQNKGPSTNIVQIDFKGTSNIYSPYLHYNKGINEKFTSIKKKNY